MSVAFVCNSCKSAAKFSIVIAKKKHGDSVILSTLDTIKDGGKGHICENTSCLVEQLSIRKLSFVHRKPEVLAEKGE